MVWKITRAKMQGEDKIKGGCKVRRPAMYMYGIPVGEEQRLRCFFSAFFYNIIRKGGSYGLYGIKEINE